jgi:hypothetical protein
MSSQKNNGKKGDVQTACMDNWSKSFGAKKAGRLEFRQLAKAGAAPNFRVNNCVASSSLTQAASSKMRKRDRSPFGFEATPAMVYKGVEKHRKVSVFHWTIKPTQPTC